MSNVTVYEVETQCKYWFSNNHEARMRVSKKKKKSNVRVYEVETGTLIESSVLNVWVEALMK